MIFFIADAHFCHTNIIKMCGRPFTDVNEMNETLIANWNAVVSGSDEIYILGDFLYKGSGDDAKKIANRLNGKKYLIKGNHEKYLTSGNFDTSVFEWIKDYYELSYRDARFILFHYPIAQWAHFHRKSAHLHGHCHRNTSQIPEVSAKFELMGERAINVGVDLNNYFPVSAESVYERAFRNWKKESG